MKVSNSGINKCTAPVPLCKLFLIVYLPFSINAVYSKYWTRITFCPQSVRHGQVVGHHFLFHLSQIICGMEMELNVKSHRCNTPHVAKSNPLVISQLLSEEQLLFGMFSLLSWKYLFSFKCLHLYRIINFFGQRYEILCFLRWRNKWLCIQHDASNWTICK